jgi:hypothetical protein
MVSCGCRFGAFLPMLRRDGASEDLMAVGTFSPERAQGSPFLALFGEGFGLLRERWKVYALFAAACAAATGAGLQAMTAADDSPEALVAALTGSFGIRSLVVLALLSVFFIMPSALRRLDPAFRMTPRRFWIMLSAVVAVGLATEIGTIAFILPGIAIAVLWSQATIGAVLSGDFGAFRRSFRMTKDHFFSTFAVVAGSLVLLAVPVGFMYLAAVVAWVRAPASLIVTLPLVLIAFIYFDCVRYAWLVRWYARLSRASADRSNA